MLAAAGALLWASASAADPVAAAPWTLARCEYDADQATLRLEWLSGTDPATAARRGFQIGDHDAVFAVAPESFAVNRGDIAGFELRSAGDKPDLSTFAVLLLVGSSTDEIVMGEVSDACAADIRRYFTEHRIAVGRRL